MGLKIPGPLKIVVHTTSTLKVLDQYLILRYTHIYAVVDYALVTHVITNTQEISKNIGLHLSRFIWLHQNFQIE